MAWLDTIRELWPLITALAGIAVVIATLWLRSKFTPIEDHRAVVKRVGVLETHASGIDERVKHAEALLNQAPTRQELQEDIATLGARMTGVEARIDMGFDSINTRLATTNDYLHSLIERGLNTGGKS